MRLSQSDLAQYLDVAQATLSQATSNGHKCAGFPVQAWAVYDGAGRVSGYDVPTHVVRDRNSAASPSDSLNSSPDYAALAASPIVDEEEIRSMMRDEIQRQNPAPEQQKEDYFRPASAGGLSYVMARAVDGDSATARAAVLSAATLFGGLVGHEASDHWVGALCGALIVGGIGYKALGSTGADNSGADTSSPDTQKDMTGEASSQGAEMAASFGDVIPPIRPAV